MPLCAVVPGTELCQFCANSSTGTAAVGSVLVVSGIVFGAIAPDGPIAVRRLVERAAADSWWQLLMLHGALDDGWRSELFSYEAPSYYGMLCAAFTPGP
jgi:hypothetical protein